MDRYMLSLCFALICCGLFGQDALVKVKERGGLVYSVFFHADYEYDVSIKLQDAKGKTLISEKVYSAGFDKPYNLRNLPQGSYKFQVKYSDVKFERSIEIGEVEQEVVRKERVAKEKSKANKKQQKEADSPVLIAKTDANVLITVVDPEIEALGVFFYLDNTDEFEYFYWEPTEIKEQSYKLAKFQASALRVEVVEDGKVLAQKQIAKN